MYFPGHARAREQAQLLTGLEAEHIAFEVMTFRRPLYLVVGNGLALSLRFTVQSCTNAYSRVGVCDVDCDATARLRPGFTSFDPLLGLARQLIRRPIECSILWQTCAADLIAIGQLGCKRSRVQIPAARPNPSVLF